MFYAAGATHKGTVKTQNEDHILVNGKVLNEGFVEIQANRILAVIADGVSGEEGGQIASRKALEVFQGIKDKPINGEVIYDAFQNAHIEIRKETTFPYMATTVAGCFMDEEDSAIFNVGDSKAFIYKFGALRQLSLDHTTASELIRQGIKSNVNPHQLSRYLGGKEQFSEPEIKENTGKIKYENSYLLLCSDGLTDFVKVEYIEKVLESEKSLLDKAKTLIALAIKCKTTDNVSVIIVEWKEDSKDE